MNRNQESHFTELPKVEIERSIFDRSFGHKTSFNCSDLVPFYFDEVLPGDTFNVTTSVVARMQTLLTPIMDNVYMDTYYFFVPMRIIWEHTKEFFGENSSSAWIPSTVYQIPQIEFPSGGWNVGTIADHLGVPPGVKPSNAYNFANTINALPFRAYAAVCNEWFRDQNLSDPVYYPIGDSTVTGSNGSTYQTDVYKGGALFKVAKYHDYFTSCLPAPLKHSSVTIMGNDSNLISGYEGSNNNHRYLPVFPRAQQSLPYTASDSDAKFYPMEMRLGNSSTNYRIGGTTVTNTSSQNKTSFVRESNTNVFAASYSPSNLWADLGAAELTINELRLAFQLQKFYEKQARGGTRYREVIHSHFGVTSDDARMMIPEYLGGHRFPLSIHQVANQASSSGEYLGDVGAMSNTSDVHSDFIKSFTEHGYVIGVCCVRYDHSYPQGLDKFWLRKDMTEFYWPVFANIGEQPIRRAEIYLPDASETSNATNTVFGYQEPWAEYRMKKNYVSSEMRPGIANSLATWHLSDYYTSAPSLSDSWIREDKGNVDRVLAVQSSTSNQIFADFWVQNICTRPMPLYSIPGLIDHH